MPLNEKRVLVTGGGAGMGRAIAIEAAAQGAQHVCVADLNEATAEETVETIRAAGGQATALVVDLTDPEQAVAMIDQGVSVMGGLDSLVNNAGVLDTVFTEDSSFEGLGMDAWNAVMNVNLVSVWRASQAAAPHLLASDRGPSIVNAGSVAGMTGYSMTAYSVSKAAVIQLTRVTAIALAPKVRVNVFCPGSIETPMSQSHLANAVDKESTIRAMTGTHLIPRFGRVEEVGKTICFLLSDDASFLTGVVLPVDGGTMAWRGVRE